MNPPAAHPPARRHTTTGAEPPQRRLNLGVVAHIDAGKTSLTEALLHAGGALARLGRVDDGTTRTDTLALERQRGITIRSAVATFEVDDVTVNLVDTPGHPDFIAEVDRSLTVLDGAVLVLSAVEGVQAQTIVLYRALRRLDIPVVFFVNKIDQLGADPATVLDGVRARLSTALVPLGHVRRAGTPAAAAVPCAWHDPLEAERLTTQLAEHDDELLAEWLAAGHSVDPQRLRTGLGRGTRSGALHPVLYGSARTGAGIRHLSETVADLLSASSTDGHAPPAAQIFKVERSAGGQRIWTARMRAGALHVRDRVVLGDGRSATVTALEVFEPAGIRPRERATAGQIARLRGLDGARIGDWIGRRPPTAAESALPEPGFEAEVFAQRPDRQGDLHRALSELADIDPLIALRGDRGALRIRLYGEVQQQVLAATLATEYGLGVDFGDTGVVCVERPSGTGFAVLRLGEPGHPYPVTLGLRVEPTAPGVGVELLVAADQMTLPLHVYGNVDGFRAALLEYCDVPLRTGPHGWRVTDLRVTVTDSGYPPAGPRATEVRHTTELVVGAAVRQAGTDVCGPVDRFVLDVPAETLAGALSLLGRHDAVPETVETAGSVAVLTGTVRTAEVAALRRELPAVTHGLGVLESDLDHYTPVRETNRSRHP